MKIWIPLVVYLAVQSITPGPNNLTCLYLGGVYGLRGTRKFLTASMLALSAKAFLCGALNIVLAQIMPSVISWLKWLGAAYMLYMAWNIMKSGWEADEDVEIKKEPASYKDGIILQIFNGKSWMVSVVAFSAYVIPISTKISTVLWVTIVFAALALAASLIWALLGSSLKLFISRHKKAFGIVMGLSLVYCAVSAVL